MKYGSQSNGPISISPRDTQTGLVHEDGDPLDVLVMMDSTSFRGCLERRRRPQ
jgi:inorganic pyrophosphatase